MNNERVTPKNAAKELQMDVITLRELMKREKLPIGCTAMYDTIIDGTEKLKEYRDFLKNEGMRVKAVFAIFGDGMDNSSQPGGFAKAKKAVEYLNVEEIVTAFISFGGQATQEAKDLGFKNILDVSSSASELRRAFNCLSKSVIENSKSAVSKQDDFFDV